MLATGCVKLHNSADNFILVRVLFDTGSEVNLITEKCANQAKLPRRKLPIELEGVTGTQWADLGEVFAKISPWFERGGDISLFKSFIVMKKLPTAQRNNCSPQITEFKDITRADPSQQQQSQATQQQTQGQSNFLGQYNQNQTSKEIQQQN